MLQRLLPLAPQRQHHPHHVQRIEVARLHPQHLLQATLRLLQLLALEQLDGARQQGLGSGEHG